MQVSHSVVVIVEVDFLWNRTVDSLKTSSHPLLWTSSGLRDSWKTTPYMGEGKLTEHAQNLQGCEKCNLRKEVGNLEMPYGYFLLWEIWKSPMGISHRAFPNFQLLSLGYTFHTPVVSGHTQWSCLPPYKVLFFSYLSDLMKSTVVDES